MASEIGTWGPAIIGGYQGLQLEVVRLKYVLLKTAQSYEVSGAKKIELRDKVAAVATEIGAHVQGLADKKLSRYNMAEFARVEGEYIKKLSADIRKLQIAGLKVLRSRENLAQIPIREAEVDEQLLQSRIFDAPVLGKDQLGRLNAARRFLPSADPLPVESPPAVDKELQRLKLKSYVEGLAACETRNPDILFRVREKLQAVLAARAPAFVTPELFERADPPRTTDLIAFATPDGRYGVELEQGAVRMHVLIETSLQRGGSIRFVARITGWAEVGASRTEFSAAHADCGRELPGDAANAQLVRFLDATGAGALCQALDARRSEWAKGDADRVHSREQDSKARISKALDELG
jgi:hypothetical protein